MIETTHIRLEQAAALLNTDVDTLLTAVAEGRIRASWLLNESVWAERGKYLELADATPDEAGNAWVSQQTELLHFFFVPLQRTDAAALLKYKTAQSQLSCLTEPGEDGEQWKASSKVFEEQGLQMPSFEITLAMVFVMRSEIDSIREQNTTPAEITEPVPVAPKQTPSVRESSVFCTLGALMGEWPGGNFPSSKALEESAKLVKLPVSDDTIRHVLAAVVSEAPTLKKCLSRQLKPPS